MKFWIHRIGEFVKQLHWHKLIKQESGSFSLLAEFYSIINVNPSLT
jgi:hypothetical protein